MLCIECLMSVTEPCQKKYAELDKSVNAALNNLLAHLGSVSLVCEIAISRQSNRSDH